VTTRLYWHNTSNATSGLPTTKQSTVSVSGGASQSVNKDMTITIGTSQTSIAFTENVSTYNYVCRWVSDTIGQSSIAANTWTISYGYSDGAISNNTIRPALYVWRPSTTTKVATIFDSDINNGANTTTTEQGRKSTFSGSAVASGITTGDVLCLEFIFLSGSAVSISTFYDGTTVVTTDKTAASSVAAYIETPETIALGAPASVTATVTGKTNTNKFINKV
jgi:hypothetical protein